MRYLSKAIFVSVFVLISTACSALNPFHRDPGTVKVGPESWYSLVVYFKPGTTAGQVASFQQDVLSEPRSDGRGEDFKEGIGSYLRLSPSQAYGHWGFAITFYENVTGEQRAAIIDTIKSNELVLKVFENTAPNDIKDSDLR